MRCVVFIVTNYICVLPSDAPEFSKRTLPFKLLLQIPLNLTTLQIKPRTSVVCRLYQLRCYRLRHRLAPKPLLVPLMTFWVWGGGGDHPFPWNTVPAPQPHGGILGLAVCICILNRSHTLCKNPRKAICCQTEGPPRARLTEPEHFLWRPSSVMWTILSERGSESSTTSRRCWSRHR